MSRIGKLPITIPAGVEIKVSDKNLVTVKGALGSLQQQVHPDMTIEIENGTLSVKRPTEQKRHKAMHGLYRTLIANMVHGVSKGYQIKQELVGVGYKATHTGKALELSLGFSHSVMVIIPNFRSCSTCKSHSQAPLCYCTLRMVTKHAEGTFGSLRYAFGGDHPSQTTHQTLSPE
jgi:large subunit ribosomal protein L6